MKSAFILVLASLVASVWGQEDPALENPVVCSAPGAQKLDEIKNEVTVCSQAGSYTRITLTCDWANYRFGMTVTPGVQDGSLRSLNAEQKPNGYAYPRAFYPQMEEKADAGRINCNPSGPIENNHNFPYVQSDARMVVEDGRLYYKTQVLVKERYALDASCNRDKFIDTPVELSCCATPLETEADEVTVPLHQYCPQELCKINPPSNCSCKIVRDGEHAKIVVKANNYQDLDGYSSLGFQLVNLDFYPNVASPPRESLPKITAVVNSQPNAALSPHLALVHPDAARQSSVTYTSGTTTTLNHFTFSAYRNTPINAAGRLEYCIVNRPATRLVPDHLNQLQDCVPVTATA